MRFSRVLAGILAAGLLASCSGEKATSTRMGEGVVSSGLGDKFLEFPADLWGDLVIAERLVSYAGAYWEDGSGESVENVAGLMIHNSTDKMLEFGAFSVEHPGGKLYFFAYQVPPHSRCLVLEYGKKAWDGTEVISCRALNLRWTNQELSREQIDYLGLGPSLTVINRDERILRRVSVWYKRYDKQENCYLGGVAESTLVLDLQPGEHRTIKPEYYDAATGRIVKIQWEI